MGFNTARVYLHNLVWEDDAEGFIDRINQFLEIASIKGIKPIFVFFDDRWNARALELNNYTKTRARCKVYPSYLVYQR